MVKYIRLRNLVVHAAVGCLPGEKTHKRPLELDVELKVAIDFDPDSDALDRTVDYRVIRETANTLASERAFSLVETFADMLATRLASLDGVRKARVVVRKPGALPGRTVPEVEAISKGDDD